MNSQFIEFNKKAEETVLWLREELSAIRTGRASVSLVEKILVDAYGTQTPINQVSSVHIEDAKTLKIAPWDKNVIPAIQTAIDAANLGVSSTPDESGVRIIFPDVTAENREHLAKLVKERLESARVSIRKEREEVWNDIQKQEKDKSISEDDKFMLKDELQELVDGHNKKLEEVANEKEKEILES